MLIIQFEALHMKQNFVTITFNGFSSFVYHDKYFSYQQKFKVSAWFLGELLPFELFIE